MRFDASGLRRTGASGDVFPWRAQDVTFVCVTACGLVTQAQTIEETRAMLEAADDGDLLLAAWLASGAKTYLSSTTAALLSKESNRQASGLESQRPVVVTKTIEPKDGRR
jgi:hypothetical protein